MKRSFLPAFIFLFLPVFYGSWDTLDIKSELATPGTKLVAVDFYATWCEPCNRAIPRWKKLQEKYGHRGLKVIVVSVQSQGSCARTPNWTPDKVVCDYEGQIASRWGADELPQAFLWSWQGNLLVNHGRIDDVENAIERYFRKIPRILVEDPVNEAGKKIGGTSGKILKKLIRAELKKYDKIEVIATKEERGELRKLRKESHKLNYDNASQCKLGMELSANSLLRIHRMKFGSRTNLVLEVLSAEKGCLTATATAPLYKGKLETAVAGVTEALIRKLLGTVNMPGGGNKRNEKKDNLSASGMDENACDFARNAGNIEVWREYLKKFPDGSCSFEANIAIKKGITVKKKNENEIAISTNNEMVTIPAGWFYMGCVSGDSKCTSNENPRHKVYVDEFQIDIHEVTVEEYKKCFDAGVCSVGKTVLDNKYCNYGSSRNGDHPMNCINWHDAKTYCEWKGKRPLTEAEWEKAARGGKEGAIYPWGNENANCSYAVLDDGGDGCGKDSTLEVCSKPKNGYGLCDMSGNVWEWCNDWYDENYYKKSPAKNPENSNKLNSRVFRGGSWYLGPEKLRTSLRNWRSPNYWSDDLGFRCAK